jgi:membrane protein DedA with SNARE-associated domain
VETTIQWVIEHGYPALFGLLALGVVGAPIPDETLLVLTGAMVSRGQLHPVPALAAAFGGSITGITVIYGIGRFASRWLLAGRSGWRKRIAGSVAWGGEWFRVHGPVALSAGYFLPGVRHLAGIAAGTSRLPYGTFSLYAYGGALLWTLTFLAIGWSAGEEWARVTGMVHSQLRILKPVLLLAVAACLLLSIRRHWSVTPMKNKASRNP